VPGEVYITGDGNFVGTFHEGKEATWFDRIRDVVKRIDKTAHRSQLNVGFTGLPDLIYEQTRNTQRFNYRKTSVAGVTAGTTSLWLVGTYPAVGVVAANAPGGSVLNNTTTGGFTTLVAPNGTDTLHIESYSSCSSAGGSSLLLYDRLFSVNKTMASTTLESVTGVPTRYQNTSITNPEYIGGNFIIAEVSTTVSATAHTWTVDFVDEAGGASTTTFTGTSGSTAGTLISGTGRWFIPLGVKRGVKNITAITCSASLAAGAVQFGIGRPIAMFIHPLANTLMEMDFSFYNFNMVRVLPTACLAFIEPIKAAGNAATYTGQFSLVGG
jgi:hypothetical protein